MTCFLESGALESGVDGVLDGLGGDGGAGDGVHTLGTVGGDDGTGDLGDGLGTDAVGLGVVANLDRMDIPVVFRIWKYESENEGDILKEDEVLDNDKGWKMVYISTWVEPEGPGTSGCVRMQ